MTKRLLQWMWLVMATMMLTACLNDDDNENTGANVGVGDALPTFSINVTVDDAADWRHEASPLLLSTQNLRGKRAMLVFFNTGCSDCQQELPVVQAVYDRVKSDSTIHVVCISRAEGESGVRSYWQEHVLSLPYSAQTDKAVYEKFASYVIPRIYIANKNGTVTAVFTDSPLATETQLLEALERAE